MIHECIVVFFLKFLPEKEKAELLLFHSFFIRFDVTVINLECSLTNETCFLIYFYFAFYVLKGKGIARDIILGT